ncbi:D-alanyl-D-alanine carboxypeptidase/D-alanyl-D-alanine-endopeptidase [Neobacillus sp. PS3-40]|uniref:D-alanyl-D-alanine carboxypeptidase/D-alanyl-D-alanine endopeptidase n=1 Tax=Neobacillus sp. PS3-40 TaxID=3070679 RepID=UPI0027E08487|nr:D-alanyl-D-alanine carboxypeptidase/D-alanyl-D-alanine-endopeptidase [Neobacillus sp. PS3-40]WML44747.1 D-alanyl-D-alanine carboxypeptidase/D-alanyl-D-alanine-endopeptidase [Neobacillus sp. PS3-40]
MKKKSIVLLLFIFILALVPTLQSQEPSVKAMEDQEALRIKLNQLLKNEPDLNGAIAGISIRSASGGQIIYSHFGDVRLRPASNMKLLTAAAALSVLGENHTFLTEVLTDGMKKKNTLKGNLYLKGMGDPTLLKKDFNMMAENLKNSGVKKINGDLVGDDYWYDNVRYSIDLPWSDESTYYGAQVSALTSSPNKDFDAGTVIIEVLPGKKIGDKAFAKIIPKSNYVKIVNKVRTVAPTEKKKVTFDREHGKNIITINGIIPVKAKKSREWISVWDPTRYAVVLFKQSLAKQDIKINGKIKIGVTPKNAQVLTSNKSMPLSALLIPFMKLSNNGHAEILIKEIGKVSKGMGSWEKGLSVLKTELTKLGVNPKTIVIRDGSGISHVDLIPPNQISYLLYSIQKEKWFPFYLNSLPVGGKNEKMLGGSLRNRFKNSTVVGRVQAKTGTISTVSSLSGYVKTNSGQTLIFSILLNNLLDESKGKKIEDKIVGILVNQ